MFKETKDGFNIFEVEYDRYKGKNEISGIVAEGMCFRFAEFLKANGYAEDEPIDVYNNTSGIRDGNRLDIHDNYDFVDGLEFSYLYSVNGTVWAVLYDPSKDSWYGEVEIPCV